MAHPPRQRRQRTPEEIERSKALAKESLAKQEKQKGLDNVKRGRTYIFVVAAVVALSAGVDYYLTEVPEIFYFYVPVILIFVALGIYYYRNPVTISYIALSLFILLHVFFAVLDPTNIAKGIVIKILVIVALVNAIKYAKKHKDDLEKQQAQPNTNDILDDELIDFK